MLYLTSFLMQYFIPNIKLISCNTHFLTPEEQKSLSESFIFITTINYKILPTFFFYIKINNIHEYNYMTIFFYLFDRFSLKIHNTRIVGFSKSHKFIWTNFSYSPFKYFTRNKSTFANFALLPKKSNSSKKSVLSNIIYAKKKSGFLKKKDKTKNFILLRANILRNFKIFFLKKSQKKNKYFLKNSMWNKSHNHYSEFHKFMDFSHKSTSIFFNNRSILKNILRFKKLRQYQITKFFSKIIKGSFLGTKLMFEFSLYNVLIRAGFAFTFEESLFLIKNNFVFINGSLQNNPYFTVKKGDVISLILSKKFYRFYKTDINKKIRLTFSLGYILWRLNRFKNNFYKQSPTRIPDWVYKLMFCYEDVPSFLEVDYTILAFSIIKTPDKFNSHNFYFNKFINFFMMRQYNWKYLV